VAGTIIYDPNNQIQFYICSDPNNPNCKLINTPGHVYSGSPLRGLLKSSRPLKDCGPNHLGAKDLTVPGIQIGTPVFAAEAGTILQLSFGWDPCGCNNVCNPGNFVGIRSYSDNFITHYVHVNPLPGLKPGDHVNRGQQIGTVDVSGSSCQPHVHMARYTPNGSPTCNWLINITQIFHPF
jgi:murein DD-endopeptidase MepM/ murein hydrolase activator NlpD